LIHNQAFNVGRNSDNYRVREIAEIVEATVPGCQIEYAADAKPDPRCYRVDCRKITQVLPDFQPQWDARKGAAELYAAYQKVGLTLEDFEGQRYKRVAHLQGLMDAGRLDSTYRWY
jgi:nucleoside-diphosphate-sugar epimerase